MELFKTPGIDWIGKRKVFFAFSGLLLAASAASILLRGFDYSIDFVGGTMVQVTYPSPKTLSGVRDDLEKAGFSGAEPQSFTGTNAFGIRLKGGQGAQDAQVVEALIEGLRRADPRNAPRVDRREFVGPAVGRHLKRQAIFAIVFALLAIIVYVAFRFSNPLWGAAGVLALLHDVLATAGLFSMLRIQVDLVIVAALMTIAGYSINDTIVIFDRMRERMRLFRREAMGELVNASINETLSRTLITNGCVVGVVGAIFAFGGPVLHDFAIALLFGGMVGTYSTVAIATPLVYQWESASRPPSAAQAPKPAPKQGARR